MGAEAQLSRAEYKLPGTGGLRSRHGSAGSPAAAHGTVPAPLFILLLRYETSTNMCTQAGDSHPSLVA